MIYSGSDFERRYKLSVQLIRLNGCGLVTDDEVQTLRQWFGLRSDVWIIAEMDINTSDDDINNERNIL